MDLYYLPGSPPCRSVLMVGKALGIKFNKKLLNTFEGEQLKPEFVKINPQHTIPTLVDNGFSIWESRAIIVYLVEKYGKDDSLYPKDHQKRALVNQRLYFDLGTLNPAFSDYFLPQFRFGTPADPELFKKLETALGFLDTFLDGEKFVAGDHLTLADIALLATVSTILLANVDISKYPNLNRWYQNTPKITPGWDENVEGLKQMKSWIDGSKFGK